MPIKPSTRPPNVHRMAEGPARTDAVIAGVNKAGTTSLFVSLSTHPDVAPSAVKETRYFLPACYGQALEPFTTYQDYFDDAGDRPVRLEATPSYFYGGAAVATKMSELLTNPRVLLILREPVSRALSFFAYQKIRLRFPADLSIADYLAAADALGEDDFRDPENEKYMAFRGGLLRRLLAGMARDLRHRPAPCRVVRGARLRSGRSRRSARGMDRARPHAIPQRRARAPKTGPPGSRTKPSRVSRSRRTTDSNVCSGGIPMPSESCARSTTSSTASPSATRSPGSPCTSSPTATASPTRGSRPNSWVRVSSSPPGCRTSAVRPIAA